VFAQRTVTNDAGGGRKIVLHYNAADKITETDTLGANGELLEKDVLEYRANAYVPQTLSTSYWPNGKPHKVSKNTYDDNSNFTGEFIQVYDESGKQISGHRLMHDPQSNTYHCEDWNTTAQNYVARQCPAGEESQGSPETAKKFTQQEVEQQLTAARKMEQAKPAAPSGAPAEAAQTREVGVVLPSHIRVGERVSGSVVEDPAAYENMPQVTVTRFVLPLAATGQGSTLAGWSVLLPGEAPQPADGPIALTIPPGQVELAMMFQQAGTAGKQISHAIPIPPATHDKSKGPTKWEAPATCVKGGICMVHGQFTGNSSETFAAFSDQPAKIVAETTTAVYLAIPAATDAGTRPLVIAEAGKAFAFPMVISAVGVQPDGRTLKAGEQLLVNVTLEGSGELPEEEWRPGNFPPSNVDEAGRLVPGYQLPRMKKEDHEAEERREKAAKNGKTSAAEAEEDLGGEILLVVKATSADGLNFRGSNNGTYVFRLHHGAFQMGDFKYNFVVDAPKGGSFAVQWTMLPMLGPIRGQEFVDGGK
jgi:hypothetical protein